MMASQVYKRPQRLRHFPSWTSLCIARLISRTSLCSSKLNNHINQDADKSLTSQNKISEQKLQNQNIDTDNDLENNINTKAGSTILKHQYIPRRHAKRLQKYEEMHSIVHRPHKEPKSVLKSLSNNTHRDNVNIRNVTNNETTNTKLKDMLNNSDGPSDQKLDFPSDISYHNYNQQLQRDRDQSTYSFRPKTANEEKTSILMFPGQGSQFVGMGEKLIQYPNVIQMYEYASSVLGYDLLKLCLKGPKEELDKTVKCQPAVFVTSLAAVEKLQHDDPQVLDNCISVAGFSVGEYAALVFAEAMSFHDALKVIKVRGEAMQEASELVESGMMSVFTTAESRLGFGMLTAREFCRQQGVEEPICRVANFLYPQCKVVAGHTMALEFLQKHATEFGLRRIKHLPVSGAFHTELMKPAKHELIKTLREIEIHEPKIPVHSNITSHRHRKGTIIKDLGAQIHKPVKWEQILHVLYTRSNGDIFPLTYEPGPGKQLGTLLRLVNAKAHERYQDMEC